MSSTSIQTQLFTSAECGDVESVREALASALHVDVRDDSGSTALMRASSEGHIAVVHFLLERGADVEARDNEKRTSFMHACWSGFTEIAQLLLDRGSDIEARDGAEWTPLMFACDTGYTATAQMLLDRGADVNAKDCVGRTALRQTMFMVYLHKLIDVPDYQPIIDLLVARDADLESILNDYPHEYTKLKSIWELSQLRNAAKINSSIEDDALGL